MPRIFFERQDTTEDLRRWLVGPDPDSARDQQGADCFPPADVVETPAGLEVVIDLPGMTPESITVLFRVGVLLVTGTKQLAPCTPHRATFHLAERGFGRFARAIRFSGAFDASHAEAVLKAGELHITIPRIDERRGRDLRLAVKAG